MVCDNECTHYFVMLMTTLHGSSSIQGTFIITVYYFFCVILFFRITYKSELQTDLENWSCSWYGDCLFSEVTYTWERKVSWCLEQLRLDLANLVEGPSCEIALLTELWNGHQHLTDWVPTPKCLVFLYVILCLHETNLHTGEDRTQGQPLIWQLGSIFNGWRMLFKGPTINIHRIQTSALPSTGTESKPAESRHSVTHSVMVTPTFSITTTL